MIHRLTPTFLLPAFCSRSLPALVVAGAIAIITSTTAHAAAAKPKPVVGQLVLGGTPSAVTAYSWTVTADSSFTKGSGASVGKPNPSAIRFTKLIDPNSIPTLQRITTGASFPSAVFTVTFGKGNGAATMVYEMEALFVTNVTQGAADGLVTEEVSFVFKVVKWTFTDASGNVTTGTWDVPSGAVS
jgi:type VI secretion system secreted protein Hcp